MLSTHSCRTQEKGVNVIPKRIFRRPQGQTYYCYSFYHTGKMHLFVHFGIIKNPAATPVHRPRPSTISTPTLPPTVPLASFLHNNATTTSPPPSLSRSFLDEWGSVLFWGALISVLSTVGLFVCRYCCASSRRVEEDSFVASSSAMGPHGYQQGFPPAQQPAGGQVGQDSHDQLGSQQGSVLQHAHGGAGQMGQGGQYHV